MARSRPPLRTRTVRVGLRNPPKPRIIQRFGDRQHPVGPTIALSNNSQLENTGTGTTIGALSVVGGSGSYTFAKTVDGDSAFTLTGTSVKNAIVFDYETATFHTVTITADNGVDPLLTSVFTVLVLDVAEAGSSNPTYFILGF